MISILVIFLNSSLLFAFQISSTSKSTVVKNPSTIIFSERREFLERSAGVTFSILGLNGLTKEEALALTQAYPNEIQMVKDGNDIESIRKEYIATKKKEIEEKQSFKNFVNGFGENESVPEKKTDTNVNTITSMVWAGALWLLSGSRQNVLVNPMVCQ